MCTWCGYNSSKYEDVIDDIRRDPTYDILFRKSSDGGGTFGSIINLGSNAAYSIVETTYAPAIALYLEIMCYLVWTAKNHEIILRKSSDGGGTFGNFVTIGNNTGSSASPSIPVSGNNVYVVWQDITQGNHDILFRKSSDGGGTVGSIINLSNNIADSAFPAIALSGNNVYVVWQDITQGNHDILFRKSSDGGIFGSIINLSNNIADSAFPAIAVLK